MPSPILRTDRIARLRQWQFDQKGWNCDREILWHRYMFAHRDEPIDRRYGGVFGYLADNLPAEINDDELIVGRLKRRDMTPEEEAERKSYGDVNFHGPIGRAVHALVSPEAWESIAEHRHTAGAMTGHMTPDYPLILAKGLYGLRRDVQARLDRARTAQERAFCEAAIASLNGGMRLAQRYSTLARELAASAPRQRRDELLHVAEVCRRVPAWPARTFHEAAQVLWFIHYMIAEELGSGHGCFCPGRVDQYLGPYYERDVAAGRLTRDEAYEILACLFLKYAEFDPFSVPQTLFVGGQHPDGSDASNEVSLLCLEVSHDIQMLHPALCVSWHPKLSRDVMRGAVKLMRTGIGFPAIFNDTAIVPGLMRDGASREDAVNYMAGSCVEISAVGRSNPWVASGYVNAGKALERVVQRVARSGRDASWDDLVAEFKVDLAEAIRYNVEITSAHDRAWQECVRYPFLSCLVSDCIERATDLTLGGARYNTTMPELVGLANVVDGLFAIRWACFEQKAVSLADLADILRRNWESEEALRRLMSTRPPHYGNDLAKPDGLWVELADYWYNEVRKHKNPRGGAYQPGFLCWIMHSILGEKTGATPDGRKAGEALADSIGPVQGHDAAGVTAMLRSAAKMDHSQFIGGIVTNVKFTPSLFATVDSREKIIDLLETYLHLGGFELQVNVVSGETLHQAQDHPEEHANLIVRVGGYSDYFTRLSRTLQDEIIRRTEHAMAR